MSSMFTATCETCEMVGPRIHRSGPVGFWPAAGFDFMDDDLAQEQWVRWLIDHEYCDLRLVAR